MHEHTDAVDMSNIHTYKTEDVQQIKVYRYQGMRAAEIRTGDVISTSKETRFTVKSVDIIDGQIRIAFDSWVLIPYAGTIPPGWTIERDGEVIYAPGHPHEF
jgi:hypothetical protein